MKRKAILGLDNSHNKDFKVAYASDPVLVIRGGVDVKHEELKQAIKELGLWNLGTFNPIEIPTTTGEWENGYVSCPEDVSRFIVMYDRCKNQVEEHELLGGPSKNGFTVMI